MCSSDLPSSPDQVPARGLDLPGDEGREGVGELVERAVLLAVDRLFQNLGVLHVVDHRLIVAEPRHIAADGFLTLGRQRALLCCLYGSEGNNGVLAGVGEIAEHELRKASVDEIRRAMAASIACRAAIKINMRLEPTKMDWLLRALAATSSPMSCPHGRPIALRYATRDILKSFHRI